MRPSVDGTYDMSSAEVKRQMMSLVGRLSGMYELRIKPRRATRSLRANSWYFGFIVKPLYDRLRELGWDVQSPADVHEMLATHFLPRTVFNHRTGEVMRTKLRRSTKELSVEEFTEYADKCVELLAEKFDVLVVEPVPYAERQKAKAVA